MAAAIFALICVALAVPLLFASPYAQTRFHLGVPRIYNGDEPHYLIAINSLIRDRDLDLSNNYAAARAGEDQAGQSFAKWPLAQHTAWYEAGRRRSWLEIYDLDSSRWDRDGNGVYTPRLRTGEPPPAPSQPQYSTHPPGLALLLAPALFVARGTSYVEPLAIASSTLAVILAMFFYVGLLRKYAPTPLVAHVAALVTFLGTPAWHYARTLFSEPLMMLCAIGAYSFALRDKSMLVAGAFIGIGLLIKSPFALLMLPILAMLLFERRWLDLVGFCAPVAAALATYLALNVTMFGSPFATAQGWLPGSTVRGVLGSLFSPQYGYLIVAPAIIAAFLAWPEFFRRYRRDATVLGAGILLHFLFYASYGSWSGSTCYAARYVVPLLPLIFVPLAVLPQTRLWRTPCARYGLGALCAISIAINGVAAMAYWKYWDTNPVALAMRWIFAASVPG